MTKKIIGMVVCCFLATWVIADIYCFDNQSPEGDDWMDGDNWVNQTAEGTRGTVPGPDDTAQFNSGEAGVLSADAGTIKRLQIGFEKMGGTLTLNEGATLKVLEGDNCIGNNGREPGGTLVVNGGSITFAGWTSVARNVGGQLEINGGEVRVEDMFFHNEGEGVGMARTSIKSGTLDVNAMTLNSGVLDFSGGKLLIRADTSYSQIINWIATGRMTIKGSSVPVENEDYVLVQWGDSGYEIYILD